MCAFIICCFLVDKPGLQTTRPRRPWGKVGPPRNAAWFKRTTTGRGGNEDGSGLGSTRTPTLLSGEIGSFHLLSFLQIPNPQSRRRRDAAARGAEQQPLQCLLPHGAFSSASTTANPVPEGRRAPRRHPSCAETPLQAWFARRPALEQEAAAPRAPRAPFVPWNY